MKTNIKALISELSVVEKIELLDCLYHELSGHGTDGDTELAHINTREASVLKALGGSGTVNEITGLRQYGKGSPPPPPSSQSVEQKIPEEISPYIKDILAKGQAIQEKRTEEGYQPYQGSQLADFTPEQQQAMSGISGLVGTGQQYFDPAAKLTASSARQPTGAEVGQYMSPYMQQVVDIQQREAQRQGDVAQQGLAAQAVGAGGFGGSRQAILEAEASRNLQTQLGDIQAKGLAGAYEDAQARLAAQRQRELSAGAQFAGMAPSAVSTGLQELGALQQVGGMKQAQTQAGLDIAKGQFEAEKTFPEQTLQQYSSLIRGYAMDPNYMKTTTNPAPSYLQQIAGLGTTAFAGGKAFGLFKEGGKVGDGRGIASIIVKRKNGGKVIKMQVGGLPGDIDPTDDLNLNSEDPYGVQSRVDLSGLDTARKVLGYAQPTAYGEDAAQLQELFKKRDALKTPLLAEQERLLRLAGQPSSEEAAYLKTLKGKDFAAERKGIEEEYKKDVEGATQNKWLALMGAGLGIMGQGGGQTALEGIGKGFTESGFIKNVSAAAQQERDAAKEKRSKLTALSDKEIANQAAIAGISKDQRKEQIAAELKILENRISQATQGIRDAKDIMGAKKSDRGEAIAVAKVLADLQETQAKLLKAAQEKGMKPPTIIDIKKLAGGQFGYTYDEKSGGFKFGGDVFKSDDPRLVQIEQITTGALDIYQRSGGGAQGLLNMQKYIEDMAFNKRKGLPKPPPPPAGGNTPPPAGGNTPPPVPYGYEPVKK